MLVDDHPLWRETLRKVIERQGAGRVVAETDDGEAAIRTVADVAPDIVVMDVDLPGIDGIEATAAIVRAVPTVKVLFLSAFDDRQKVLDAVTAGASGYLLKTAAAHEVAGAVARVNDGELVFPPHLAEVLLSEVRRARQPGVSPEPHSQPSPAPAGAVAACRREGEFWTLEFEGLVVRIAHMNGLTDLARLLATPQQEVLAAELVTTRAGVPARSSRPAVLDDGLRATTGGGAGPLLDNAAKRAYRARVTELRDAIDEAERLGDIERASQGRHELQFLTDELAGAVGLGGRDRPVASNIERARVSVTRGLRRAIKRIEDAHPSLGIHLDRSVRTGTFCCYDPEIDITWVLS